MGEGADIAPHGQRRSASGPSCAIISRAARAWPCWCSTARTPRRMRRSSPSRGSARSSRSSSSAPGRRPDGSEIQVAFTLAFARGSGCAARRASSSASSTFRRTSGTRTSRSTTTGPHDSRSSPWRRRSRSAQERVPRPPSRASSPSSPDGDDLSFRWREAHLDVMTPTMRPRSMARSRPSWTSRPSSAFSVRVEDIAAPGASARRGRNSLPAHRQPARRAGQRRFRRRDRVRANVISAMSNLSD